MADSLGLFCLEGNWDQDLTYSGSIRPVIELLKNMGLFDLNERPPIYRDVCTYEEFRKLTTSWGNEYDDYRAAYFASHGDEGVIVLDKSENAYVELEELAEMLRGRCRGRVLFLGGCSTLGVPQKRIDDLFRLTRARAVCGYRKQVDTIHAAALETVFFGELADHARRSSRIGDGLSAFARTRMFRHIAPELGFSIWDDR
jgi:hypothetical protein